MKARQLLKLSVRERQIMDIIYMLGEATVAEVLDIPEADVEPPPNFKTDSGSGRYISGIAKVGEDVKIIVDVSKILQDQDLETISTGTQ